MSKVKWKGWEKGKRDFIESTKTSTVGNMERACKFAADQMRANAPERSGRLKKAIGYEVKVEGNTVEGYVGVKHGFWRTHVARFLEFGTSRMPAKPFMRRSVFGNKDTILRILRGKKG